MKVRKKHEIYHVKFAQEFHVKETAIDFSEFHYACATILSIMTFALGNKMLFSRCIC